MKLHFYSLKARVRYFLPEYKITDFPEIMFFMFSTWEKNFIPRNVISAQVCTYEKSNLMGK
jgi:hypothetical protein